MRNVTLKGVIKHLLHTLGVIRGGEGYFVKNKKEIFIPNGQVLLGKARTRFETVCANQPFRGQNGHFWPKQRF